MTDFFDHISIGAIPIFIVFIIGYGIIRKTNVYETFVEGAKGGLTTILRIFPYMVAMFVAIGVFRYSGALEFIMSLISPITGRIGLPPEVAPLAIMRPISGIGSVSILGDIFRLHGPDSFVGRVASTMMGSTETIFYTLSIYFGALGIKKIRYTLWGSLIADIVGIIASIIICSIVFNS